MQVLHSATDTADPPRQTKIGYLHRPLSRALAVTDKWDPTCLLPA